ncbi:PD-(D/E)XK nuclease family protein (plasmid) [Citricoccus nitrophenolicus]
MQDTAEIQEETARDTGLLGDLLAWDGRQLVLRDPEVADARLRRKALSPSTAKAFSTKSCVARWVGEKLMPQGPEDPFDAAPLGTGVHAVLENLYKLPPQMRSLSAHELLLKDETERLFPIPEDASDADVALARMNRQNWMAEARTRSETIFFLEKPAEINVFGCETKLDGAVIDGVPTTGYIDRLDTDAEVPVPRDADGQSLVPVEDHEGNLLIKDYKTGQAKVSKSDLRFGDDHGEQMRIYALALHDLTGKMPAAAALIYTNGNITAKTKGAAVREVDLSPAALDKTREEFVRAWKRHNKLMKTAKFPVKVAALCGWCPLVASCPAAIAEGKVAKLEGLPTAEELGIRTVEEIEAENKVLAAAQDVVDSFSGWAETGVASAHIQDEAEPNGYGNDHAPQFRAEEDEDMIVEGKSWEKYNPNNDLNPASFAATAGFGLTTLAMETLHRAGAPLEEPKIKALAGAFSMVTTAAQKSWTGSTDLHDGANMRMRGALRTSLEMNPFPVGGTVEQIKRWMNGTTKRLRTITGIAVPLADAGPEADPWLVLGSDAAEVREAAKVAEHAAAPATATEQTYRVDVGEDGPSRPSVDDEFENVPAMVFPDEA